MLKLCNCVIPVPDFKKSMNMSCWRHNHENLMLLCGYLCNMMVHANAATLR